ncbi:MAG: lamin tail domain-containing protein [Chloroflexota bacterium]|nr:lamin tail domain-containing protein [Chloroflexota bacterium]
MPIAPAYPSARRRLLAALASIVVLAFALDHAVAIRLPADPEAEAAMAAASLTHLVVSEVMTGGASASDEFIELYNPAAATLPLEGLEVVYVTASGATLTRKASWPAGTPGMAAGMHLLLANGAGVFAAVADVAYANGLAATGGSVALRVVGAATAIDAVGWGNATSTWLETRAAPAPPAGSSVERLPGGPSGSTQDIDDNLVDFAVQPVPDPQNSGSPPVPVASASPIPTDTPSPSPTQTATSSPTGPTETPLPTLSATSVPTASATPSPSPAATTSATPSPSPTPTPTPAPTPVPPISIAGARSQPDGSQVTVEGTALTASDFTDGGGYVVDATAGIAVLVTDGSFSRGQLLRITGGLDDRYAQRTIRAAASSVDVIGPGSEPLPADVETGSVGEALEGSLAELTGVISSSATTLSTGLAWDLDDGSGPVRVVVGTTTGIDTSAWSRGVRLTVVGVVGQRDSSGSGTSGFRFQPRDTADVLSLEPAATPTPSPSPTAAPTATPRPSATPTASASPTPSGSAPPTPGPVTALVAIAQARAAASGAHVRIQGVVTAQSGLLEEGSAVVQDTSGAILVRLGGEAGRLGLGQLVELDGTRSTKAGMLTLRVSKPPVRLGTQADPEAVRRATGTFGERDEARLVIARGVVSSTVSRPRTGGVSFSIDDGSGPIRVTISAHAGTATGSVKRGAWLELRGVLGQETTAKAPLAGYRLWPRAKADLRVVAAPVVPRRPACCAPAGHGSNVPGTDGSPGGTTHDDVLQPFPGTRPALGRPRPTGSPRSALVATAPHMAPAADFAPRGAGLIVAGMGVAALAALAAWFGRRRRPDETWPAADPSFGSTESEATRGAPRLSLLRVEAEDAQEERRILPPI